MKKPTFLRKATTTALALVLGIGFFSTTYAATQEDNLDDASTTALTAGNAAKFTAPAAGTDEVFTIADNVNVGDTSVVVTTDTANGVGRLNFLGTSTATGVIGATGARLGLLTGGIASEVVTLTGGSVFVADMQFTGAGTISLGGATTVTNDIDFKGFAGTLSIASGVTGGAAIDNDTDTDGTITFVGSATVGAIGATNAISTVTLSGSSATVNTGNFAGSTVTVGTNTLAATGTAALGSGSTLNSTISNSTTVGQITSTGNATVNANTTVALTLGSSVGYLANGTRFTLVNGAGGTGVADLSTTITDNSSILRFAQVTSNDADLIVEVVRERAFNTVSTSTNTSAIGTALEALGASASGDVSTVLNALDALSSTASVANAVAQIAPETNGAVLNATYSAQQDASTAISDRQEELRLSKLDVEQGLAAGQPAPTAGAWLKAFGGTASQDKRKGIDGYDSETAGGAIGMDKRLNNHITTGISYAYAETDVDHGGSRTGNSLDFRSNQGVLYSSYDLANYYIDGLAGFAYNEYDSRRLVNFGTINRTATASYTGTQYGAQVEGGYIYNVAGDFSIIPLAGFRYNHLDINAYQEQGASTFNLRLDNEDYDRAESILGTKFSYTLATPFGKFIPMLRVAWLYDFVGDTQVSQGSLGGSNTGAFTTESAEAQRHTGKAGVKLALASSNYLTLSADYDATVKDEYIGHSGNLTLRYDF